MKPPIIAAAAILLIIAIALTGCAPLTPPGNTSKRLGSRDFTRVGEVMLQVYVRENPEDASGNANPPEKKAAGLPERPQDRGYSELGYVGLNTALQPVFRRRDVDVITKETPSQPKVIHHLPPVTMEFALDYSKGRYIRMRDHTVEIIEATPAGVTFSVQ
jgi:hypothetical protein